MQSIMQNYFGVYRNEKLIKEGIKKLEDVNVRTKNLHMNDKSKQFNSEKVEILEYLNLIEIANATALPFSIDIKAPFLLPSISPSKGPYP